MISRANTRLAVGVSPAIEDVSAQDEEVTESAESPSFIFGIDVLFPRRDLKRVVQRLHAWNARAGKETKMKADTLTYKALRRYAYHEAGHAVTARICLRGSTIENLSLRPPNEQEKRNSALVGKPLPRANALAVCAVMSVEDVREHPQPVDAARCHAIMYLAGIAAEIHLQLNVDHVAQSEAIVDRMGYSDDESMAEAYLSVVTNKSDELQVELERSYHTARATVAYQWAAVEAVAERLLVRRNLNGMEATSIIDSKRLPGDFRAPSTEAPPES